MAPNHSQCRSIRVKLSIDIHGYLRGQRRAVDGGRHKVDTCEKGRRMRHVDRNHSVFPLFHILGGR